MTGVDLIMLAGGHGSRLGGNKTSVMLGGRTLLSRALDAHILARHTVVVGPSELELPADAGMTALSRAREDPPFGGPVAGIAAGLVALAEAPARTSQTARTSQAARTSQTAEWTLVLACDLPWALDAGRVLVSAAEDTAHSTGFDGIYLEDHTGRAQWLSAIYRTRSLRAAAHALGPTAHGASMRTLVRGLVLSALADPHALSADVDTWDDVAASTKRLTDHITTTSEPTESENS